MMPVAGAATAAVQSLREVLARPVGDEHPRQSRIRINGAISFLIRQSAVDGTDAYRRHLADTLIEMQSVRSLKDRKWFAPMGFDSDVLQSG